VNNEETEKSQVNRQYQALLVDMHTLLLKPKIEYCLFVVNEPTHQISLLKSKHFYIIYINNILFYYCEFFFVIQNIFLVGSEKSEINFGHTNAVIQCSSLLHLVFSNGHKTDGICKVTAAEIKFIKISSGHSLIFK
jgi:hypothetical protein